MAENTENKAGAEVRPEDIQSNNADVKTKLEAQDMQGHRDFPKDDIFGDASSSLDRLRDTAAKAKEDEEEAPVVEAKETPAKPAETPAEETPAASETPAAETKTEDLFKDVQLPPGARPKSAEAFAAIKIKASQEIAARESEISKLRKEVEERDAKLRNPVPAETEAELKELREFRAKFDIDADPKFQSFDTSATQSREFIYSVLSKNPNITADTIEAIKKYGGPENVKMEKIFAAMQDPQAQRLIESRIAEIEIQKFNKEQAQKTAKQNVSQYISDRQKQMESATSGHNEATKKELDSLVSRLDWMKPKTVGEEATPEEKTGAEAHNKFLTDIHKQLESALQDDSPEMRAIMIAGMGQLFYAQKRNAELNSQVTKQAAEITALNTKLAKFKNGSLSRLDNSAAKVGAAEVKTDKEQDIFNQRATDSLDAIRNRVIAERERAGQ